MPRTINVVKYKIIDTPDTIRCLLGTLHTENIKYINVETYINETKDDFDHLINLLKELINRPNFPKINLLKMLIKGFDAELVKYSHCDYWSEMVYEKFKTKYYDNNNNVVDVSNFNFDDLNETKNRLIKTFRSLYRHNTNDEIYNDIITSLCYMIVCYFDDDLFIVNN